MGMKRIVAYFMHEYELAEANKHMSNVENTDSYLLGDIEETDIPALQKSGVIVQPIEARSREETPTAELVRSATLRGPRAAAAGPIPTAPAASVLDLIKANFYLLD